MFTLTGIPRNRRRVVASITWNNGQLTGEALLVKEAKDLARLFEGRSIGFPSGPKNNSEHLKNPHASAWLLGELFRPGTIQVTGELEPWPEIDPNGVQ